MLFQLLCIEDALRHLRQQTSNAETFKTQKYSCVKTQLVLFSFTMSQYFTSLSLFSTRKNNWSLGVCSWFRSVFRALMVVNPIAIYFLSIPNPRLFGLLSQVLSKNEVVRNPLGIYAENDRALQLVIGIWRYQSYLECLEKCPSYRCQ